MKYAFQVRCLTAAKKAAGALIAALGLALTALPAGAQVQPVVSSTSAAAPIVGTIGAGPTVTDACGNLYINQSGNGGVIEIAAGTGVQTVIQANNNGYNNGTGIAMDAAKANLYFPTPNQWYSSAFTKVPITNCTPGAQQVFANNLGNIGNYYYGTASSIAADAVGNVFFASTCCSNGTIIEESAANVPSNVQTSWPNAITSLAVDASDNVYFTDGSANVYVLKAPVSPATTYSAAVPIGSGFMKPVSVSFDSAGNLYVGDGTANLVYEIPYETSALNPAHQFVLAPASPTSLIAIDSYQNLYYTNYNGYPTIIHLGSGLLPSTTVGSTSASTTVTYEFNGTVTPTTIAAMTGTVTSSTFTLGSGSTCVAGKTYTAGTSCTEVVTYTPSAIGQQRAAVLLSSSTGAALNATLLRGIGLGASVTIDPGTLTSLGTGFKAPTGITVDAAGNTYVVDATNNTLTMFARGSTTGKAISTGSLMLSGPMGVAVDALGDVFVADTGNNRIVEVPVVNGVLTGTSSVALGTGLKGPTGLVIGGAGNMYIADTGNNRMLYVPAQGGVLNFAATQAFGSGLSSPSAVALDASGNIYIADTGNNAIEEFVAPLGSQAQAKVVSGLSSPTGVATDASGSLFVADKGSGNLYRYPNVGGILGARTLVSNGISNPFGVATDAVGNLYITDQANAVVDVSARVQTALQFGVVNIGTVSSTQSAIVNASGNQSVTFPSPSYTASGSLTAGFSVLSDGCGSAGTIVAGNDCTISANFTPSAVVTNAEEDLLLLGNAVTGAPKIALIGSGAHLFPTTVTVALTTGTTPLNAGAPVSFTATIGTGTQTFVPGGSVKFSVNGTQVATVKVTNGAAVLSLPNGLPQGTAVMITAVYSGDGVNYGGSTGSISEVVLALPTSITLTAATPYNNPDSANDLTPSGAGPNIPLTAVLSVPFTIIPGGTVTFYSGTKILGTSSVVSAAGVYQATLPTMTSLHAGTSTVVENNSYISTYQLTAVYSGDTTYGGSTSAAVPVSIVAPSACAGLGGQTGCPAATSPVEITGATFSVSPTPLAVNVAASTTGVSTGSGVLTITSYGGWTGLITFTCTNLPIYAVCNPYPGVPLVIPSTPTAAAPNTQVNFYVNINVPPTPPTAGSMGWWAGGAFGLLLLVMRRRIHGQGLAKLCGFVGAAAVLTGMMGGLSGCGSGSTSTQFITPSGTTNVTVTMHAAQLVPGTTTTAVQANDVNVGSFQMTLTVK